MLKEELEKFLVRYNFSVLEEYEKYSKGKEYSFICNKCGKIKKWKLRTDRNLVCNNCNPYNTGSSAGECELCDLCYTTGYIVEHNNRQVINPKEIDIYFPQFKFGIEYDGSYWHNEKDDEEKDKACKEKGITLYRINNYDWIKDRNAELNKLVNFVKDNFGIVLEFKPYLVKDIIRVSKKCKKIICTDTMKIYDNYKEAMKDLNCKSAQTLLNTCIGKFKTINGYHICFYEEEKEYTQTQREFGYKSKHIKCIETGKVYQSLNQLKRLGFKSVWGCLNGKQKTSSGFHWEYTTDDYSVL